MDTIYYALAPDSKNMKKINDLISFIIRILGKWLHWDIAKAKPQPTTATTSPAIENITESATISYLWGTKIEIRHSIRVIADEEGLSWLQKEMLCDICQCESGFVPTAKLVNSPKSVDRGLFQINNYWHPQVTDEMAYNPEWSTRWACTIIKANKNLWTASQKCWNKNNKYSSLL